MPKRKSDAELIKLYKSKIRKIQDNKEKCVRRRRVIYSESESDFETNEEIETPINNITLDTNPHYHDDLTTVEDTAPILSYDNAQPENISPEVVDLCTPVIAPLENTQTILQVPVDAHSDLDPEIRLALGDPGEDAPVYGENIHTDLAQRWLPLLRKGLTKEAKDKIMKEHHIPDNCRLLKAPSLNPEIAAAVPDVVRSRDKKIETKQGQLGLGITAISKAMSSVLNDGKKVEVIRLLSEGCRILTDLHYQESQTRTKLITPCLDKSFLNIIQNEERDDTLFGTLISEKIKASKIIEKQGLQIKRTTPVVSKSTPQQQIPTKPRQSGNWAPPPRYTTSANRGGRVGTYPTNRTSANYRRNQTAAAPQPAAAPPQTRQATRSRAPTRR